MLNTDTLKGAYTNEQVLVILLTRLYFGTQGIEEVCDFLDKERIDWLLFYKVISDNDIRGFTYHVVSVHQLPIDQQIYNTLKKDAMAINLFGSYQADLIRHLEEAFEKLGVTAISYKGNTLATRYYKAPLLRESSDIDFLVNKDQALQVRKYLLENGYEPRHNVSAHQLGFAMRFHREFAFRSPKDGMGITCSVDLQWKLLEDYLGPFHQYDFLSQHLQSYTTNNGVTRVGLAPTYDFLCVASHHLIREPLMRFKYLIDLACIVQTSSNQLDWEELNLHFKQYKFSAFLWSGMRALEDIIGLRIPVSNTPVVAYHLFTATALRSGRKILLRKIRLANLMRSFPERIKFGLRARLSLLIPNFNDLSMTNAPAWTIPFIIPVKSFRFLYLYIVKKH